MEVGIKESASKEEPTRKLMQLAPTPLAEICHGSLVKAGLGCRWFSFFRSQKPNQVLVIALNNWWMVIGRDQIKFARVSGSTM